MRGGAVWLRAGCGLGALLGTYLVASGLLRLLDSGGSVGGPVARVVVGALLLSASAVALLVSQRELPRSDGSVRDPGPRPAPGVEAVTCPRCSATNAPSAQFCHGCDRPLR